MIALPTLPGVYAVQFSLAHAQRLDIGQLGRFDFAPGAYIYLGSAHGPGGLKARLGRHLKDHPTRLHWHIDYLRQQTQAVACCYWVQTAKPDQPMPIECRWSQVLAEIPGCKFPVEGFGASDCRAACPAHLVFFDIPDQDNHPVLIQKYTLHILADAANILPEKLVWHNLS
jgi:Uri superfamily endonuclease